MGKPDLKTAAGDSPHTRCSNCETVFEVSPELLSAADTRVRCGECLSIFDALANLCSLPPELSLVGGTAAADTSRNSPESRTDSDRSDESPDNEDIDSEDFYSSRAAARPHSTPAKPLGDAADLTGDSEPGSAPDHNDLDATYADFDLFSGDAELPEVAYFDQSGEIPDLGLDDGESDHDETFSDTLFVRDAAIGVEDVSEQYDDNDDDLSDDSPDGIGQIEREAAPREELVFKYRDADAESPNASAKRSRGPVAGEPVADGVVAAERFLSSTSAAEARPSSPGSPWLFRIMLALSLLLLLSALFTYRHRHDLHNNATIRPLLLQACSVIGCTVPSRVAIDKLKVLERSIASHPSIEDALTIELAFANTAEFEQRYPTLVIRLSDTAGNLVARREFTPGDYADDWEQADTIDSLERIDVTLEIRDPGANAMSLEFDFQAY